MPNCEKKYVDKEELDEDDYYYEWDCFVFASIQLLRTGNRFYKFITAHRPFCTFHLSSEIVRSRSCISFKYENRKYTVDIGINEETGTWYEFTDKDVHELVELYCDCRDVRSKRIDSKTVDNDWNLFIHTEDLDQHTFTVILQQFDKFTTNWEAFRNVNYIRLNTFENIYFIRTRFANTMIDLCFPMRNTLDELLDLPHF